MIRQRLLKRCAIAHAVIAIAVLLFCFEGAMGHVGSGMFAWMLVCIGVYVVITTVCLACVGVAIKRGSLSRNAVPLCLHTLFSIAGLVFTIYMFRIAGAAV